MKQMLKYILFRCVLIVVTLHTLIPHPHSDELTEKQHFELHQYSDSLLGLLRLTFHESNDEGLDNLIIAQYNCVKNFDHNYENQLTSVQENIRIEVEKETTKKVVNTDNNNFNSLFFVKLNRLRGPPVLA